MLGHRLMNDFLFILTKGIIMKTLLTMTMTMTMTMIMMTMMTMMTPSQRELSPPPRKVRVDPR